MKTKTFNQPVLFYSLSTTIPWGLWLLAAYISHHSPATKTLTNLSSVIAFIGLLAPLAITLYMASAKPALWNDIRKRIFNFRNTKGKYLLITSLLMLASILLAQAVSLLFGYPASQFQLAAPFSFTSGVFPVWFMLLIAPLLEELAWHTYGTDCLRTRFNLFHTSLIFGLFWGIWHLPLSFIKDYYHNNLMETGWIYGLNFLVSIFPFVMIMNWLYYKTNRNILVPVIFHITAGYFNEIFATHPMSKVIQTGLLLIFSFILITKEKNFFFNLSYDQNNILSNQHATPGKSQIARRIGLPLVLLLFILPLNFLSGQSTTQTIRGQVCDNITKAPLPFSSILVVDSDPLIGTTADMEGNFCLQQVPVGRITLQISMVGYDTYRINELWINSGKEELLKIGLQQSSMELDQVVVRVSKESPLNAMTTLSARQFTVEETRRYAGGMDDPARLASAFAGVASPSVSNNGISVRGNNPDGLLWRIEGVEVPAPSHFANLSIAGGGMMSAISSQMMGNSDFYTGAFPAEYGNASSGVFDIKLNSGNSAKRQYTFQAGVIGVDLATQGPFVLGKKATYNMNYRNSTMALLSPILPDNAGILKYQDLAFKMNFPTRKAGTFSVWGLGALDGIDMEAADSAQWESNFDRDNSQTALYLFASGVAHKLCPNPNTFIHTSLSISGNGLEHKEQRLDYQMNPRPQSNAQNKNLRYTLQSSINKRFSKKHNNKTGISYSYLSYTIDVAQSTTEGAAPRPVANKQGHSGLLRAYSQSKINVLPKFTLNLGMNSLYFMLNKNLSIEPRAGISYQINQKQRLAFAFGLHSRIEQLPIYFVEQAGSYPNKQLDLMKSAHYVLAYNVKLNPHLRLGIEPYYQHLSHIPVAPGSYMSTINNNDNLFFDEKLISRGTGRNLGIDLTIERFIHKGFYYLITASVFDSKYTAADGVERNTRFNKNFVFNALIGKEWDLGKNNSLGANIRLNYMGGNRKEAIDLQASLQKKDMVYAETNGQVAFKEQQDGLPVVSFSISYRKNRAKYASMWSLQVLNATNTKEYNGDYYNLKTGTISTRYNGIQIPNISYKIMF